MIDTAITHNSQEPLASRLRPKSLAEFAGQAHLLSPGKPLYQAIQSGHLHSLILWGPPGVGKTTLARMIAQFTQAQFIAISAVLAGVKDIREVLDKAKAAQETGQRTVVFVDEVHRFNKAQQDAFLPSVESGLITFIGATTENPSFEVNRALLSRLRVYVLKPLSEEDLLKVLERALTDKERGLGAQIEFPIHLQKQWVQMSNGDVRRLLNGLEMLNDLAEEHNGVKVITEELCKAVLERGPVAFDKGGDVFYDLISALHKSVRGSDVDASLYWLARMIKGGCDPLYIARRVVRMASEDIGNADPKALGLALNAWDALERLGSPEGELMLAQVVAYFAALPKSNAVYKAWGRAQADAEQHSALEVPLYLRNAPTRLMKDLGMGKNYRYAHDEPSGYAKGVRYFPEEMDEAVYYEPVDRGVEAKLKQWLVRLKNNVD